MTHAKREENTVRAYLLQVGVEIVPVYGDDRSGWSFESGIGMKRLPIYQTLEELYFALVNMNLCVEGSA